MSLLPYLFPELSAPSPSFFNNFALSPSPEEILTSMMTHPIHVSDYYRKLHSLTPNRDPSKFQVCLDVHQFAPNEIKVKTIGRQIVIEAQHEERIDEHGYISRRFCRKYALPQGHEPNEVVSSLSSDGVLTITAPRDPIILPAKDERIVPILQTGPVQQGTREHSVEHLPEPHHHHHHHKKEENAVPLAIKYII